MKSLITIALMIFSFSALANHFECYKVINKTLESKASRYLIPVDADLKSGGIFASIEDEKINDDFDFHKLTRTSILMNHKDGSFLQIDNRGLKRNLVIKKLDKDGVLKTENYVCFEESSI